MIRMTQLLLGILAFGGLTVAGAPYLGYVNPAGGKAGEKIEVLVGGQMLWGVNRGQVSGTGVTVEKVERVPGFRPPMQSQRKYLLAAVKALREGKALPPRPENTDEFYEQPYWDNLDKLTPLQFELVVRDLYFRRNPLQMSPSINETMIVTLAIASDAAPGERELRLGGRGRLSNPLRFFVSNVPEVQESVTPLPPDSKEPAVSAVPGVANGVIMPGETDSVCYRLHGGKTYSFELIGRYLQPFIGDGVPGHFQPLLELCDAGGQVLAHADDRYFNPDPVLVFTPEKSGTYLLRVRDALYRGRADFVYRVEAREGTMPYPFGPLPELPIPVKAVGELERSKTINHPVMLTGVLDRPGAADTFKLALGEGEVIVCEVYARRLNSPLDSLIQFLDDAGKVVAFNDDFARPRTGEILQDFDSYLRVRVPRGGIYGVRISDTTGAGGADFRYALRIDRPRPDFKLYVSPSAVETSQLGGEPAKVIVERQDGFDGEIALDLLDGDGVSLIGASSIPAGCDSTYVTLGSVRTGKTVEPRRARLQGTAEIQGRTVMHSAAPGDEAMQAFAYIHLKPARDFYVSRIWKGAHMEKFQLRTPDLKLAPGGRAELAVAEKDLPTDSVVTYSLYEPPAGIQLGEVRRENGVAYLEILADAKLRPGDFNIVLRNTVVYPGRPGKDGKARKNTANNFFPAIRIHLQ